MRYVNGLLDGNGDERCPGFVDEAGQFGMPIHEKLPTLCLLWGCSHFSYRTEQCHCLRLVKIFGILRTVIQQNRNGRLATHVLEFAGRPMLGTIGFFPFSE